jgi:hypothetical protein
VGRCYCLGDRQAEAGAITVVKPLRTRAVKWLSQLCHPLRHEDGAGVLDDEAAPLVI